jgi:hypothetical protein
MDWSDKSCRNPGDLRRSNILKEGGKVMKRFLKASTFLCVTLALFAALLLKAGGAQAAGAPPFIQLNAVAAVSAHNLWAVGYSSSSGSSEQPLVEHWNGTRWSLVPAPDPNPGPTHYNTLTAVAAISANDVWAVGNFTDSTANLQPLIEHWNGRQWSIVASAQLPVGFNGGVLAGIEGVSAHNVWAVGDSYITATEQTQSLIEHWDGKQWRIVASPKTPNTYLFGVAAVSAHNIWAVGESSTQPLIEHWDGKQWSLVASPRTPNALLNGVAAVSAHNIWALGSNSKSAPTPLIEHWDGKQWRIVANPVPTGSPITSLFGIAEVSAHDVWTVGYSIDHRGIDRTLIEHWDGRRWRIIPSPNSGATDYDVLNGVAAISTNDVWAVGNFMSTGGTGQQSLIEHWDGVQWRIVPGAS